MNTRFMKNPENRLLVEGFSVHAFIDGRGKIVRPPEEVADKINQEMAREISPKGERWRRELRKKI